MENDKKQVFYIKNKRQYNEEENRKPVYENRDSYDVISVGYPNWWSDAPMAVYTFLESYDFTGKTLIPFNTSVSGGFGRSLAGAEESAAGAEILEGFTVTSGRLEGTKEEESACFRPGIGKRRSGMTCRVGTICGVPAMLRMEYLFMKRRNKS